MVADRRHLGRFFQNFLQGLYVCMNVCMYVCMYVHIHTHIHTSMHISMPRAYVVSCFLWGSQRFSLRFLITTVKRDQ